MINIIAAVGKNNELGKNGDLIWKIKEDLQFFKEKTYGHDIIMGRKTFDSLPKLLEGRRHIVLTRQNIVIPHAKTTADIIGLVTENRNKDAFVIGGEQIYKQFLDYAKKIYLTEIDAICEDADAYFPKLNEELYDKEILSTNYDEETNLNYKHVLYKRRDI